jgi:hypothetical protein
MALRDTSWVLFDSIAIDTNSVIRYDNATVTSYEHYQDNDSRQEGAIAGVPYGYIYLRTVYRKKYKWVALTEDAADNAMDFKSAEPAHRWEVDLDNGIVESRVLNLEIDNSTQWVRDTTFGTFP